MAIEITVPQLGESIVEATVGTWRKREGEAVAAGETVVELETDKVNLEVTAPQDGLLAAILKPEGATVTIGEALARVDPSSSPAPTQGGGPASAPEAAGGEARGAATGTGGQPDGARPAGEGEQPGEVASTHGDGQPSGRGGARSPVRPEGAAIPISMSAEAMGEDTPQPAEPGNSAGGEEPGGAGRVTPLARRLAADHGIDLASVQGSGHGGRITYEDVTAIIASMPPGGGSSSAALALGSEGASARAPQSGMPPAESEADAGGVPDAPPIGEDRLDGGARVQAFAARTTTSMPTAGATAERTAAESGQPRPAAGNAAPQSVRAANDRAANGREEHVRLSRRRQTIARRLVEAQHAAAMLTTFNEVDMSAILELRKRRRDRFKERYGVGLGFMSFFTRAVVGALKAYPRLNAELRGDEMVVKHYYDIGIAVSTDEGLVVPVVRDADHLSFAEIERQIAALAEHARTRNLTLDELQGGTFTITNGGVFGSLLSTPILNGPQVGILGMHKIQERPIALAGQVVIHPMMYVALSYDHRIVDGAESVSFLVRVKELLEDPEVLLLEG